MDAMEKRRPSVLPPTWIHHPFEFLWKFPNPFIAFQPPPLLNKPSTNLESFQVLRAKLDGSLFFAASTVLQVLGI
jgi:hypothetical protein